MLPGYNLGWAENEREASMAVQVMVESVARGRRGLTAGEVSADLADEVRRVFGVRPAGVPGNRLTVSADGRTCTSSIFGDRRDARQPAGPSPGGPTDRALRQFAGLTATLTFEDDGLRAVVTVDRK